MGPQAPKSGAGAPAWAVLADVLLERAALVARIAFDYRPEPLAGLKVDDEDLTRLLRELPGLRPPEREVVEEICAQARPAVEKARARLRSDISDLSCRDAFGAIVRSAQLSVLEAEVLALACAVEADPRRQRLAGYLNDDVSQKRLTLFTLGLLFPEHPGVAAAVAPSSGLRRAALVGTGGPGPFGSVPVAPSATVMWWLAGQRERDPDLPAGVEAIGSLGSAPGGERPANSSLTGGLSRAGSLRLLLLPGPDRVRRRQAAEQVLGALLVSPLPASPEAWDALVRQATLEQRAVLVCVR